MHAYLDSMARTLHVPRVRRTARPAGKRIRGRRSTFVPVRDEAIARGLLILP